MAQLISQNVAHVASVFTHAYNALLGQTDLQTAFADGWAAMVEYCS